MFDIWAVSTEGQQEPTPGTSALRAMGIESATALAKQMARRTGGNIVHKDLEGGQILAGRSVDDGFQRNAKELMAKLPNAGRLTAEASAELENAIENDLRTASQQIASSEARLSKAEEQIQAPADAVVAIAEPSDTVDGAVKTVKAKM